MRNNGTGPKDIFNAKSIQITPPYNGAAYFRVQAATYKK
jgi:hypothetical protein